jgi:hypothetical protein
VADPSQQFDLVGFQPAPVRLKPAAPRVRSRLSPGDSGAELPRLVTVQALSSDSLREHHATGRAWSELLRLPFRQKRWRGQAGEFSGTGIGSSLEFQAYARTGHYTMKLYREEVRPLVDLVLDASNSMFAFEAKLARVLEVFYYAFEAARRVGASMRVFAVKGAATRPLAEEAVMNDRWTAELEGLPETAANEPPSFGRLPLRAGSMRLFLSDLLFPGAPEPLVQPLVARGGRAVIFAPSAREESDPQWEGNYEFIDSESTLHHLHRIEPGLLRRYEEAYRRHFTLWKACAQKYGVALARLDSTRDLGTALRAEAVAAGAVEV